MKHDYIFSQENIFSNFHRGAWAILLFLLMNTSFVKAEGILDVAPNATDVVMLLIGDNNYGNFASTSSPESSRLYVQFSEPGEILYLGLSREFTESGSAAGTGNYSYRIKRASDNAIVHGPYSINSFTENLSSWADASGPDVLNNGIGYDTDHDRYRFSADEAGLYYIEFSNANYIGLWDFTLANNGVEIPGRVYSKNWAFRTPRTDNNPPECVWDREFNGTLFSYTSDGFVTRLNFENSGFQGLSFTMAFNSRGPGNTGDIGLDRMSIPDANVDADFAEHLVFLSEPDPNLFPNGACGEISVAPYFQCTVDGAYCLDLSVTQPGQLELTIDVNNNNVFDEGIDRKLLHRFNPGENFNHCLYWDGLLGDGSAIDPGANVNLLVKYTQGIQHWSVFDAEFLKNGFCVEPVRPVCNQNQGTNFLYWDDRNITDDPGTGQPLDGSDGCNCELEGCRTWNNFNPNTEDCSQIDDNITTGYGDKNIINTWWFANVEELTIANVPLINLTILGESEVCPNTPTNLSFLFTSSASIANVVWIGPNGVIVQGPDAPLTIQTELTGTYTIQLTDTNGCTYSDTHELGLMSCPTDVELDITANDLTPEVCDSIDFTISLSNAGEIEALDFQLSAYWDEAITNVHNISHGGQWNGNTIVWDNLNLAVGENVMISFTAKVLAAFDYVISAEITEFPQGDIDSTPNNGVDTDNNGNCADDPGDEDDGDCVILTPEACNVEAVVTNLVCDANGTFGNAADDTYTFDLTVNGFSSDMSWTGQMADANINGNYGLTQSFGPFAISDGNISVVLQDNFFTSSCMTTITVVPPSTCSDDCVLSLEQGDILCSDNGTPDDNSDDTYTVDFRISGFNIGDEFIASDGSINAYNVWHTFGPYNISSGNRTLSFLDRDDNSCNISHTFLAPPACSNTCSLQGELSQPICSDNGTPSDPDDDTFTFTVSLDGFNISEGGWQANDPLSSTGSYGNSVTMGPYLISGGDLSFDITDADATECSYQVNVQAPNTCSDLCDISLEQGEILCLDNGTLSDASDDMFTVQVRLSGLNTASQWMASTDAIGVYDEWVTLGPFLISSGDVSLTFTDQEDNDCNITHTFLAPPACSSTCSLQGDVSLAICSDNGTPSDPNDDTFTFTVSLDGFNVSNGGWQANDPLSTTGSYGNSVTMGPYLISGGDLSFEITDADATECSYQVNVQAPNTCSDLCDISLEQGEILCLDNGTLSDASDDMFTVQVRLSGLNTASQWMASNDAIGVYNEWIILGPFPISSGDVNLTFTDNEASNCTVEASFLAPPSCSSLCVINTTTSTPLCSDSGTPSDPTDDTFTFLMTTSGSNLSTGWSANDPLSNEGEYGTSILMGPYLISDGELTFVVSDNDNNTCNETITITPPTTCSDQCSIRVTSLPEDVACSDGGTPSDASDDEFSFIVVVSGANTGSQWTASNGQVGNYDEPVQIGDFLISDGAVNITFTDNVDPDCVASLSVDAPPSCSTVCDIHTLDVTNILCNDNNTPIDPTDDTFTFSVSLDGFNVGQQWTTTTGESGQYGQSVQFGPYSIMDGDVNLDFVDGDNNSCTVSTTVSPPSTCSNQCAISASTTNIQCLDNGTPFDSGDDLFSFDLLVSAINHTGENWTSGELSGSYGFIQSQGPFLISDGVVNMTIIDADDPSCTFFVEVIPPAACSDECLLTVEVITTHCDDMGTELIDSDDIFSYEIRVSGINGGTSWTASDGTTGNYGEIVQSVGHPYTEGTLNITVSDDIVGCSDSFSVSPPVPSLLCPEDTDQRVFNGSVQVIEGYLGDPEDLVVPDPPCMLGLHSTPMTLGDRFMEPVDVITPEDSIAQENVYTFYLFADIEPDDSDFPNEVDGSGGLFRGDYMGYTDPCCFTMNYADTITNDNELIIENPDVDTTGMFAPGMHLAQRFTHSLKMNQRFSLVTSTFSAGATGRYAWVVVSEVQDSLVLDSENVTSEFSTDEELSEDLTFLAIPWIQNNPIASQAYIGYPIVEPYCGASGLDLNDNLVFEDSCSTAVLERTYYLTYGDQIDSCLQNISFRRPEFDDVVLPPSTVTLECGDEYPLNQNGFPDPLETGYPLLGVGNAYIPMNDTTAYFQMAVSYKDIPQTDTTGLALNLVREWTITDLCNGDTLYVIPQLIKIGDFLLPTIRCPLTDNCVCPNVPADIMLFEVDQGSCTATIDLPEPVISGFCDDGDDRLEDWYVVTELLMASDSSLIDSIYPEENRSISDLERGDYMVRYSMEDAFGHRVESFCQLRIADFQVPTALCESSDTIFLSQVETSRIFPEDIDLGSYDNCDLPSLEVRRFYDGNPLSCELINEEGYGEWSSFVDFNCCDAGGSYLVELRVMDLDSNLNGCTTLIEVIDDVAPELFGLTDRQMSCSELPFNFDPTDSLQLVSLFGYPQVDDYCLENSWELDAELNWNDCELGSIRRRFYATDNAGNTNALPYEQMIDISGDNSYGIRFSADKTIACLEEVDLPAFRSGGCGVFEMDFEDVILPAQAGECARIQRTYSIINSCDYDGVSAPIEISRNEDCDGLEGEEDVWLVIENNDAYIDADSLSSNTFPLAGEQGIDCSSVSNPQGYWRDINNVGYWTYTQIIIVQDVVAPSVIYTAPEPFCSTDERCVAPVSVLMTVQADCTAERIDVTVWWDQDANGSLDQDLTETSMLGGSWPNYRIEGEFPLGDHTFVISAKDGCENETIERINFSAVDCYIEQAICKTAMEVQLTPIIPAIDINGDGILDEGAYIHSVNILVEEMLGDCSSGYSFSVNKVNEGIDFSETNLVLTCEDRYTATREVVVKDNAFNPYAIQPDGTLGGPNYSTCLIQISVQDAQEVCSACVANELEIEGIITTLSNQPISNVEVQLFQDDEFTGEKITIQDGKFEFTDLPLSTDFDVKPYKNDDTNNGVTTLDLIILQRHLLLVEMITDPYVLLAADVNQSGTVTVLDLLIIQQLLLDRIETFPNNMSWRFIPAAFPLTDISADIPDSYAYFNLITCQFAQNFIGVKIGDLNGSASLSNGFVQNESTNRNLWNLYTNDVHMKAGELYRIPIYLSDTDKASGLEMNVNFDPSVLEVVEVESGLMESDQMATQNIQRGWLKGIWLAKTNQSNNHSLLTLVVKAKEDAILSDVFGLNREKSSIIYDQALAGYSADFVFNEGSNELILLRNVPDPFHDFTEIEFNLPKSGEFLIEINDMNGKLLNTIKQEGLAGKQKIKLLANQLPSGVLYYTLTFEGQMITRRMVKF